MPAAGGQPAASLTLRDVWNDPVLIAYCMRIRLFTEAEIPEVRGEGSAKGRERALERARRFLLSRRMDLTYGPHHFPADNAGQDLAAEINERRDPRRRRATRSGLGPPADEA